MEILTDLAKELAVEVGYKKLEISKDIQWHGKDHYTYCISLYNRYTHTFIADFEIESGLDSPEVIKEKCKEVLLWHKEYQIPTSLGSYTDEEEVFEESGEEEQEYIIAI